MRIKLRTKLILLSTALVTFIMATVTYLFTFREIESKRSSVATQSRKFAQNIATMQLLDKQDWDIYQNYISQLMTFNKDIIYIAIYDDRNTLRAFTLNTDLIELNKPLLTRRMQADIVRRLDDGAISSESRDDLRAERVNIQMGDRVLGSVHVGFSLIEINRELTNGITLNITLGVIFIFVFSLVSVYISGKLTRPLENLSRAMRAVNEGDLRQKVVPETKDELAELTFSFNDMIEGLRQQQIIESLGTELSATFTLEALAPLVRNRLSYAIGAAGSRLYIKNRSSDHNFVEVTVESIRKHLYPELKLDRKVQEYISQHIKGFMVHSSPSFVMKALRHDDADEAGLVMPMTVKDELFGLLFFALPASKQEYSPRQRNFAATLTNQAALALENALLYEDLQEKERLKRELEIAREVQIKLLPAKMPEITGFLVDSLCQPALEVGGDYFDFFKLDEENWGIVIADVCGKGTSAAFYMAQLKGMMLQLTSGLLFPKNLLITLNRMLFGAMERSSFITMIYGILNSQTGKFIFARAGHSGLLKIDSGGDFHILTPSGIGLGLDNGKLFNKKLEEVTLDICQGEIIVLFTDGITEGMNRYQEEFGEKRFLNSIAMNKDQKPVKIRQLILRDFNNFMSGSNAHDDISMIILKRGNK